MHRNDYFNSFNDDFASNQKKGMEWESNCRAKKVTISWPRRSSEILMKHLIYFG